MSSPQQQEESRPRSTSPVLLRYGSLNQTGALMRRLQPQSETASASNSGESSPLSGSMGKILPIAEVHKCPHCPKDVTFGMKFCPGCGGPQPEDTLKKRGSSIGSGGGSRPRKALTSSSESAGTSPASEPSAAASLAATRSGGHGTTPDNSVDESSSSTMPRSALSKSRSGKERLADVVVGTEGGPSARPPSRGSSIPGTMAASANKKVDPNSGAPPARPPRLLATKLAARRALSMGPTEYVDPMTREFQLQLKQSMEGAGGSPQTRKLLSTTERNRADVVFPAAHRLEWGDVFAEDGSAKLRVLREHFQREGRLSKEFAKQLVQRATFALGKEKVLLQLRAPVLTVGDIHGQYYDLLAILDRLSPQHDSPDWDGSATPVLFLGDYVDRGYFGCEVVFYLFALKLVYPRHYFLLRGNHECREITKLYNFLKECKYKYGTDIYDLIMVAFDALPLAAVVTNGGDEKFFCVHGGISPYIMTMEDVEGIDRFADIPTEGPICDMVWSDPAPKPADVSQEDYLEMRWNANEERKISWTYGWGVLESFLAENQFQCVIRAHQVKKDGFEEHWFGCTKETRTYPPLVTIFSAPNYCDMYHNKATVLTIKREGGFQYDHLSWSDHPYLLPNFDNALNFSLPFMITHLSSMIIGLLKVARSDKKVDGAEQKKIDEQIARIEKWNALSRKVRDERQAIFQELRYLAESENPDELFKRVMEVDAFMEMLSPVSATGKKARANRRLSSYF